MSNSTRHPAFYTTRRQLWATLPGSRTNRFFRWINRTSMGDNLSSLFDIWHVTILCGTTIWLLLTAINRYSEFKVQSANPRFGGEWNEALCLNTQLFSIIAALTLFPVAIYTTLCRTGNLANDSVVLGKDILDLRRRVCNNVSFPQLWKSAAMNESSANLQTTSSTPGLSLEANTEIDTLLLRKRGENLWAKLFRNIRPFSSIIIVLMMHIFCFPICVLEAEQLRNEVIHPSHVTRSPLDGIFGISSKTRQIRESQYSTNTADLDSVPRQGLFSAFHYPLTPGEIPMEYVFLVLACLSLIIRIASPFYFTSRRFSLLLSTYSFLSLAFFLIDVATMTTLYKLAENGVREPGGKILIDIGPIDSLITPFQCLIISSLGLPAVLISMVTAYGYGEEQFEGAVINYTQLLLTHEIPSPNTALPYYSQYKSNGDVLMNDFGGQEPMFQNLNDTVLSHPNEPSSFGLPITIAITTKFWRPPPSASRRNGRSTRRATTPLPGQYTSNGSEASSTLKRTRGTGSADMSGSLHSVTDISEPTKLDTVKRSNCHTLTMAASSYALFLATRICLTGPILKCYWTFGLRLALIDIFISVLYLICSLLLWFALGVKKSWRFRMLHVMSPLEPRTTDAMQQPTTLFSYQPENLDSVQPGMAPFLPYISYAPWITNDQNAVMPADSNMIGKIDVSLDQTNPDALPDVGSGKDSLYGCFADPGQPIISNPSGNQVASNVPKLNLPPRPPTLSDESDGFSGSADRGNDNQRYFKPLGSIEHSEYRPMSRQSFTSTPITNALNHDLRAISPFPNPNPLSAEVKFRGQKVTGSQSMLFKANALGQNENQDPTYATLATLSRPNRYRSPSVNSHVRDPSPVTRNGTLQRKNGSRVTFRENSAFRGTHDGATGSSDSGVYTNGNGTTAHDELQPRCGRLKPEIYDRFSSNQTPTFHNLDPRFPQTRRDTSTPIGDDVELSTDMTSFGVMNGQQHVLYTNQRQTGLSDSNDQLCSQV